MHGKLLSTIKNPADIKAMSLEELDCLAAEVRECIISTLSKTGGHLASNLGIVEMTIALHKVFNAPIDKFIWDVSHQTYVHKLLTGRLEKFSSIRQFKGLCGFSHPKESPYDHFHAGHAGTALSLALGVAESRDILGNDNYVVPIIGDATLTCGLALEALNNIPRDLKRFVVILNDNAMSISENVGAITHILSRMLSNTLTHKLHQEIDALVSKLPYGQALARQGHRITEALKNFVSPAVFFEHYGLSYIGPIDGHDIKKLIDTFEGIKQSNWPVVVHVLTSKGQGMGEAMKNPVSYHGAKPFCLETGKFLPQAPNETTFPKVFGKHMVKMADEDPSIAIVTPAMLAGSCLDGFMAKYPSRTFDVGIAESHAVTFCGGLAYGGGLKVVCSIYATFLQRALDNVFHDVALQEIPVVFAIDRAGISGPDGATHHGVYDISFLNAMPNMIIAQPRSGHVLKELFQSAFSWKRPAAIRYPNMATTEDDAPIKYREVGKAELLAEGSDVLIIALGHMNAAALKVKDLLKEAGVSAAVMDPVFVKPLDSELLCSLLMTHSRIVTLEEHSVVSGLGSVVNYFLTSNGYPQLQVLNVGIPEAFIDHGSYSNLIDEIGLTPEKIAKKILGHFVFNRERSGVFS